MDIIYNIRQSGVNKVLFNETVNSSTPLFSCVFTDPWTSESKTAVIIPEGTDGEWILNFEGVTQPYEDLNAGLIEFENTGTWTVNISESLVLIRTVRLQVQ